MQGQKFGEFEKIPKQSYKNPSRFLQKIVGLVIHRLSEGESEDSGKLFCNLDSHSTPQISDPDSVW